MTDIHYDNRGWFIEAVNPAILTEAGFDSLAQVNVSKSREGTIRGLHNQPGQKKLVRCLQGMIQDAVYDPHTNQYTLYTLDTPDKCVVVPAHCYHGFYARYDSIVMYITSTPWDKSVEQRLPYTLIKEWSDHNPILSERDSQ